MTRIGLCMNGPSGNASWAESLKRYEAFIDQAGCQTCKVDVHGPGFHDTLRSYQGFLWRYEYYDRSMTYAHRILTAVEFALGIPVFPDFRTRWHYDDKYAQYHILSIRDIPIPETKVFYNEDAALRWTAAAEYPLVSKLASGAASSAVVLVRNPKQAASLVKQVFRRGVFLQDDVPFKRPGVFATVASQLKFLAKAIAPIGRTLPPFTWECSGILFQEFCAGNDFDTRITVMGNLAFGFRRWNRDHDFRASGSGRISYDASEIDKAAVLLAWRCARALGMESCAVDIIYRDGVPLVAEVSYIYVTEAVYACPGHWTVHETDGIARLRWTEGRLWPEALHVQALLARVGVEKSGDCATGWIRDLG